MNQILVYKLHNKKIYKYFFILIFIICIVICTVSCFQYLIFIYKIKNNNIQTSNLLNYFPITQLYLNCNTKISSIPYKMFDSISETYVTLDIIGFIQIPKISLNYPISKTLTDKNLNLLPCKVCGPEINCFDNLFFSNLNLLCIGDSIYLYDLYNNFKIYSVYHINEVDETNTNCLNRSSNNIKEITLITCNNYTQKRLIVVAKEEA